jgi:stage II sporulation protein D
VLAEAQKAKLPASVFEYEAKGKSVLRVYAGPYGDRAQAEAARLSVQGSVGMKKLFGDAALTLAGPLYASAGTFATEAEAAAKASALRDAGVHALIAVTRSDSGVAQFGVWLGEAADEAQLQASLADAQKKAPGLSLSTVAAGAPYLLVRSDRTGTNALGAAVTHYGLGGDGLTVSAAAVSNAGVRVKERFNRSYRGAIELSRYNNSLAVVNRLPLEAYVVSAVGSELGASWPTEALKAQAVAARTYALKQGLKYGIANVTDTTADQVYLGIERESPAVESAVSATAGEMLANAQGQLIDAFYHSNSGNMTADPMEVWGLPLLGLSSVPSLDTAAERGKLPWYRIASATGLVGYVRSDYVRLTGETNRAGLIVGAVTESGVNVRPAPYVNNDTNASIGQVSKGEKVTILATDMESTSYQWIRGPLSSDRLLLTMKASGVGKQELSGVTAVQELAVTGRGSATGRVTAMAVNGKPIAVTRPEEHRPLLNVPSTRFEVEETAKVSVLGSGGRTTVLPAAGGAKPALTVIGAGGRKSALNSGAEGYLITTGDGTARYATNEPQFRFHGLGYGHGLGMSQWGAYGLAELGYDYRKILQYYYKDATLVKG